MSAISFSIDKKLNGALGRAGTLETPHGVIETPAFVTVGTQATVKALTMDQVRSTGAQVTLANTYHLYLQPGDELIKKAGGLHTFMHWDGPMMTDSGGFQAFSLGSAYGTEISKVARGEAEHNVVSDTDRNAKVSEDGVAFRSHRDGSIHMFTPEKSMEIQHNLGADMIFAFDECTSPTDTYEYQVEALERTHRWAERSLKRHNELLYESAQSASNPRESALFGIVQGGRFENLRKHSARTIGAMDFPGFGIGGSFVKEDLEHALGWVNSILPEEKPRHLLGIGDPRDLLLGIEQGCDLFDCVAPTRLARTGTLYTHDGLMHIRNTQFREDFTLIEKGCACTTCAGLPARLSASGHAQAGGYTRAYLAHLFRAHEMLGATLASVHNVHFLVQLVKNARAAILDGTFEDFKKQFLARYK